MNNNVERGGKHHTLYNHAQQLLFQLRWYVEITRVIEHEFQILRREGRQGDMLDDINFGF